MTETLVVILMFGGLIVFIASGQPLAFVLSGVALIVGFWGWGDAIFDIFVARFFSTMNNYSLVTMPLFILMASFLTRSNVADDLFGSIRYLFGPVRGGLAVAVIAVSTIFAATTGIVGASILTMGMLGLPILAKNNYDTKLSIGVICAGGCLGILIPPSIMLVMMGSYTQVSIGKLFLAAIIPGLTLSACYIIYSLFICWKHPELGPAMTPEELAEMPVKERVIKSIINMIPPMLLIIGVLGSIFAGIATPTEASGVGAFLSLIMTIFYRKFSWQMVKESVIETTKTSVMCFLILFAANAFTAIFMGMNGDRFVTNLVLTMGLGKWTAVALMLLIVFILGMFIDWLGIIMIVLPIFMPILDLFEFDRLYILGLVALILQTCFITPPFGFALFYIKGVVGDTIEMMDIYKGVTPFIIIIVVVTILCLIFPSLVMWLPSISAAA